MRNECSALNIRDFVLKEEYKDMNIWDLKYISTSDEEDNDSSENESSSSDDEEGKKADKDSTPVKS